MDKIAVEYENLDREFRVNNQLLESMIGRIREASVSSSIETESARIVDRAVEPGEPVSPKVLTNLVLGLVGGLVLGVGVAYLIALLDERPERGRVAAPRRRDELARRSSGRLQPVRPDDAQRSAHRVTHRRGKNERALRTCIAIVRVRMALPGRGRCGHMRSVPRSGRRDKGRTHQAARTVRSALRRRGRGGRGV